MNYLKTTKQETKQIVCKTLGIEEKECDLILDHVENFSNSELKEFYDNGNHPGFSTRYVIQGVLRVFYDISVPTFKKKVFKGE